MKIEHPMVVVRRLLALVMIVTYIVAAVSVISMQIVPVKYLVPAIVLSAAVIAATTLVLIRVKLSRIAVILASIIAILAIAASAYVISASQSTTSFLAKIQPEKYHYENYSVVAIRARNVELTEARRAAMLDKDPYYSAAAGGLKAHTLASPVEYDDPTSLTLGLGSGNTDVAVLNDAYMQIVKEGDAQFDDTYEVLATYRVWVEDKGAAVTTDVSKPFVVYISGIDTYGSVSSVSRSDVNMLAVVNPVTHKILLVNTPRDYYVQLHGTTGTRDKLTHAGVYGIDMSRQTLEDLYGMKIDYYVRVNFTSLESIVNTLGGVDVYSDVAFKSYSVGYNHLNGAQALEFSRERYSFSEGDRQRGKNQQRVIEAIIAKMSNPASLVNYQSILNALAGALQTNMTPQVLSQFANRQLNDMKRWQTESISVDGVGASAPTYSMGAQPLYVMVPDRATVDSAKAKMQTFLK